MPNSSSNALAHLRAGALSGTMSVIFLQPLDLMKTRVQQRVANPVKLGTLDLKKSLIGSVFKDVYKERGVLGYWRGTIPTLIRNVPGSSLFFYILYVSRRAFGNIESGSKNSKYSNTRTNITNIACGAFARATAGFILMPATVVKIRYESNYFNFNGIYPAIKSIYKSRGLRGFFDGTLSTAIRDAPYAGLYFAIYEAVKKYERKIALSRNTTLPETFVTASSGMIAGLTASYLTQPFDMVKTRMQIRPESYHGFFQTFKKIYRDEKMYGFFKGISLRVIRKGIQASVALSLYEWASRNSK